MAWGDISHTGTVTVVSASPTMTLSTSIDDMLIVFMGMTNGGPITSISSTNTGTWTKVINDGTTSASQIETWWAVASGQLSSEVITVNNTASGYSSMIVFSVEGADTTTPLDVNAEATDSSNDNSDLTIKTTATDTLVVHGWRAAAPSPTTTSGWTDIVTPHAYGIFQSKLLTAAESTGLACTSNETDNGSIAWAIQKAGGGGGGGLSIPVFMAQQRFRL